MDETSNGAFPIVVTDEWGNKMANTAVAERVREVVASTFGIDVTEVAPDASNQTLSSWSSLAHLRLVANLEHTFGVRFSMNELTSMYSVAAIEQVLASRGVNA